MIDYSRLELQAAVAATRFRDLDVVQIPDVVDHTALTGMLEPWLDELTRVAVRDEQPDRIKESHLTMGGRYGRVDVGHPLVDSVHAKQMASVLWRSGIHERSERLATEIAPLVHRITGVMSEYVRPQVLLYEEQDYLGPHTDRQSGDRYNVQLPATWFGVSGLRVFQHLGQIVFRDEPGALRVLGPGVWHEVLPVMRTSQNLQPRRAVLSLRFESTARNPNGDQA
jgi:hypothetical protein